MLVQCKHGCLLLHRAFLATVDTYQTDGGNSLMRKIGQMSLQDDLNKETPSVFSTKEIFAGLILLSKKSP